jgi:hypothetical protein
LPFVDRDEGEKYREERKEEEEMKMMMKRRKKMMRKKRKKDADTSLVVLSHIDCILYDDHFFFY